MTDVIYSRRTPFAETSVRVAMVASVLVHAALLLQLPPPPPILDRSDPGEKDGPLTVRLAPPFIPPQASLVPPPPPAARIIPPRPAPPVVAPGRPAPSSPDPTIPPSAVPAPPVTAGDLMSYVEAQRASRGAREESRAETPASPVEDENSRGNRIANANLASQRQITFGFDPSKSGGVFEIKHMGYDNAEFTFIGWSQDRRRRTKQLIEVQKGSNSDIRIAVVRKMIAIIREQEPVEFVWDSQRLRRSVALSSLVRDNAGLEDFMMQEFFR